MNFRDEEFYRKNRIKLFLNTEVKKIDVEEKNIYTENGKFEFDFLFIGTGGKPVIPDIKGLKDVREGIFTFTTFNDAKNMKEYLENKRIDVVAILGGGLIGLKCAEGLIERGVNVLIIELSNRILANTLDDTSSQIIEKKLKEKGCEVIKNDTVETIKSRDGKIKKIVLRSGKRIDINLLVIAIGVIPRTEIVENTRIIKNRGIIVNEYMQTNIPYIFAGGDVAETYEFESEKTITLPIWPRAAKQGKIAGNNMTGNESKYEGLFIMNAVQFFDIPCLSFGITNPDGRDYEILEKIDFKNKIYKKIVLKENKIVGAIYLGEIERAGIVNGLIKNKIDVSNIKNLLLDDKFGLLCLPESYRKHIVKGEGIEV